MFCFPVGDKTRLLDLDLVTEFRSEPSSAHNIVPFLRYGCLLYALSG